MLSLFPQLLFLAPLGTAFLRVAAALCFAYMAWHFWKEKNELEITRVPVVGHLRPWMILISEVVVALTALMLLLESK